MATQNISIRTEPDVLAEIDEAAKAQDRSRNWWINQALKSALADEQAWVAQVERGLAAADAGEFASDAEAAEVLGRFKK